MLFEVVCVAWLRMRGRNDTQLAVEARRGVSVGLEKLIKADERTESPSSSACEV